MIQGFKGTYRFLSSFHPCVVMYDGELYPSVEHAYQAAKTLDNAVRQAVALAVTPARAKQMGKKLTVRADWNEIKLTVMTDLVRQKFAAHILKALLLDTGTQQIQEENWWGDTFWGVCKGVGENHLGKILMQVREELRAKEKAAQV